MLNRKLGFIGVALCITLLSGIGSQHALGQPVPLKNEVWDYAQQCYGRLGMDPIDMPPNLVCNDGKELVTTVKGIKQTIDFPSFFWQELCDMPAWLELAPHNCYGNSFIQSLSFNSNKYVKGALLCRHKKTWSAAQNDYDDIAMILHNSKNGETCWFQTDDDVGQVRNGMAVPDPAKERDHNFWMTPQNTASIKCIRCHDSGPWMNSRWMWKATEDFHDVDNSQSELFADGKAKYVNSGDHFNMWPKPVFVTIARAELTDPAADQCSLCHKIAAGIKGFQTCTDWIRFTTGTGRPHFITPPTGRPRMRNDWAHTGPGQMDIAYWMPLGHGKKTRADWESTYRKHVNKLVQCCEAEGKNVADCDTYDPIHRLAAAIKPAVQIEGSLDGGITFPFYASEPWQGAPTPIEFAMGHELTLRWGSPEEQHTCALEATFPSGVSVNGISTASNFSLDEGDPYKTIGVLTAPGDYRFDLICDEDGAPRAASIVFNVYGEPYAPYLYLQTVVNSSPGDAANTRPGPESTSDSASIGDSVKVQWSTSDVLADSCEVNEVLRGEASWLADYGDEGVSVSDLEDRRYVLTCIGLDGADYEVDVTLHVNDCSQPFPSADCVDVGPGC